MTEPSRPLRILVLIPLVATACTSAHGGGGRRAAPATKAPTPRGWMLSSGQVFGKGLTATHLPDGDPQRMGLPIDAAVFDAAWVRPGATADVFVQPGSDPNTLQLEEVGMSGTTSPVGDPIGDVSAVSTAGSVFLVSSCSHGNGDTRVLPAGASSWRHVAAACQATLAPDGRSLAFSTDGHTIQTVPVAGGTPRTLVDLDRITTGLRGGAHIDEMSWGPPGFGVVLSRGPAFAVLVHTDQADHVAPITGAPGFVGQLRWQPTGGLLAVDTFSQGQGGILRAIDSGTGDVRVLAADSRGLSAAVWAPDGSLLATLAGGGSWLFIEPNGTRAQAVPVDNELPFDWAA
ncbi:MAG: hypothetical protein ACJ77A_06295 [Actinomycetota bacterium]